MKKLASFIIIPIILLLLIKIFVFTPTKSQNDYDELLKKYNALVALNNISTNNLLRLYPESVIWRTNDVFIVRDVEIGEIKFHMFKKHAVYPMLKRDTIEIKEKNGIYLECPDSITYDARYMMFSFKGLRYFFCLTSPNRRYREMQVFGKQLPLNATVETALEDGVCYDKRTKFYFRNFNSHLYFIKKMLVSDEEYVKVYRTDFNRLAIEFYINSEPNNIKCLVK